MLDQQQMPTLRRPRLLVSAAKHGLQHYNRDKSLKNILNLSNPSYSPEILNALIDLETQMETSRKLHDISYETSRHVEILVAIIAEMSRIHGPV